MVKNRTANAIFEETISFLVCALSNSGKGKAKNKFYQCEYEKRESISAILWHVEANINSIKMLKNYFRRSSHLTKFSKDESKSFGQIAFKEGTSHTKDLPKYIPERLPWAGYYFLIILWKSQLFL